MLAKFQEDHAGSQCLDLRVQAALVPRCLVLVNDALVGHAVDDRHRLGVGRFRLLRVAGLDGGDDALDVGAHEGTQARVVRAALLGLAGALARLGGVGHVGLLATSRKIRSADSAYPRRRCQTRSAPLRRLPRQSGPYGAAPAM
jgi:hypothetical protein